MSYLQSIYNNNTRYIVFIQTKYHQNILPADDVSGHSLKVLLETIGNHKGGQFRSYTINKDDITTLRIYERNFINYKKNVLEISQSWQYVYKKLSLINGILDLLLYLFVFKSEVNKFGKTITNSKPLYLIDKSDVALSIIHGSRKDYVIDKEGKEEIKSIGFEKGNLIINQEIFNLKEKSKSAYFLKVISEYFSYNYDYENYDITIDEFEDEYRYIYDKDINKETYKILRISYDNIKKSYIETINKNILEKYNREIIDISGSTINIIK